MVTKHIYIINSLKHIAVVRFDYSPNFFWKLHNILNRYEALAV